jgi:hypothetical protein
MPEKEIVCDEIPDYPKCFSYIDKGIPLYYFSCYKPIKLVTRLQVIDALSYGVTIYTGVREEDYV